MNQIGMEFYKLAKGARFEFHGKQYQKTAMSMAQEEQGDYKAFHGATEVTIIGEPLLLSGAEAEKWKPAETNWLDRLDPAPPPRKAP